MSRPSGGAFAAIHRAAGIVVMLLAAAVAGFTLAGAAGRFWWVLDLAASFRPQALAGGAAVTMAAALLRHRPALALAGMTVLVNLVTLWPQLGPAPGPGGDAALGVLSFNVGISNPERAAVMEYLGSVDPDVVVLLESSFEWEDAAAARLDLRPVAVVPPTFLSGITVLARPGLPVSLLPSPLRPDNGVAFSVGAGRERIDVLAVHPPSPTSAVRATARADVLATAAEWAAGREHPVVVIGDFNATPWSHATRAMRLRSGLSDSLSGRGLQPTWPAGAGPLMIPIDHAYHSAGLVVVRRSTGPSLGSAHRPLLVHFARAG
jgi:endonuclease/exonuclease/phosphatase (EEP) superfamily protein YafD